MLNWLVRNRELNLNKLLIFIGIFFFTNLNVLAKESNHLENTSLVSNRLKLTFRHKIKNIKYFTIKKSGVIKHIFDIKNGLLLSGKTIKNLKADLVNSLRIGQFNQNVLRVVIESKYFLAKPYRVKNRTLTIYLPAYKKVLSKTIKQIEKKYHYSKKRHHKLIILDAGHGGRDVGASNKRIREKNLTLSMTLKLRKILKQMGYRVLMTRSKDKFINLKQRTDFANRYRGDIFISIHVNAAPIKRTPKVKYEGITVFYFSTKNTKRIKNRRIRYRGKKVYTVRDYKQMTGYWKRTHSRSLALKVRRNILTHLRKRYRVNDKGIKRKPFWVLLATTMPSILVETGYISNKNEIKKLQDKDYQRVLVEGIAKGVNSYFGL